MSFDGLPGVCAVLRAGDSARGLLFGWLLITARHPGEVLASAGDDGNVILWVPSDLPPSGFGADAQDDKESWRAKHMCRSSGAEIYDLAWSPDAAHFIIGSMDNVARIYNANTGLHRPPSWECPFRR